MKIKDKFLIAFLVSAGLFSLTNAKQYVRQLSDTQKGALIVLASDNSETIVEPPRVDPGNNKIQ